MSQATITTSTPVPQPLSMLDRLARQAVISQLAGLQRGQLTLHDAGNSTTYGKTVELTAAITINSPRIFRQAILGGTLSVAESYLRGDWDCDDLTSLFRIFLRNGPATDKLDHTWARIASLGHRVYHWWHANTRAGSRQNIAAHYDLGNDFYRLWLDETLAYSSGIFLTPRASMREASVEKFDRICRKLELKPTDELLEIGTGWGGFALHAAENYGCRVTTTTISAAQYQLAKERVEAAGLSHRIRLLKQDYRDLSGQFDKLVSIEMIEAVGFRFFDDYFRQCSNLLKPNGSFVLQAIVMPERGYEKYLRTVDFIQRFVFPGGCLPSLGAMLASVARTTDFHFVQAEDFAPHYAETLRRWRSAFHARLNDVRQLGHSEEFIRLWNYYLCYCEAAFAEQAVGVLQLHFDKPERRREPQEYSESTTINHAITARNASTFSPSQSS